MPDPTVTITQGPHAKQKVLSACGAIMDRQGLRAFDREGNRGYHWLISPELVEDEWQDGIRHEIAGIPVLLAPPGGSAVELVQWVDGAEVAVPS
jgi:hypothetical protein